MMCTYSVVRLMPTPGMTSEPQISWLLSYGLVYFPRWLIAAIFDLGYFV